MVIISDAELLIPRSQQDKCRLIMASRNRGTILQDCENNVALVSARYRES